MNGTRGSLKEADEKAQEVINDTFAEDQEEESPSLHVVKDLALWEVIRELDRRKVSYNVLQPRKELESLLIEVRRDDDHNDDGDEKEVRREQQEEQDEEEQLEEEDSNGLFASLEDALAWTTQLSDEELQTELEFYDLSKDDETKQQSRQMLVQLLAELVLSKGGKEASSSINRTSMRKKEDKDRPSKPITTMDPDVFLSSKGRSLSSKRRASSSGGFGGEELYMDVEGARRELAARMESFDPSIQRKPRQQGDFAGRPVAPASPASARNGNVRWRGEQAVDPSAATNKQRAYYEEDKDADDLIRGRRRRRRPVPGEAGGDLLETIFDRVTRVTDDALTWATSAKSKAELVARDALLAAASEEYRDERVEERRRPRGSQQQEEIDEAGNQRKRKRLSTRSQRLSRIGGLMARAGAESLWQVVLTATTWAGGGLLPGRYVLLGVGGITLLLRNGLATFLAMLLVVRTVTTTLKSMLFEDEEINLAR